MRKSASPPAPDAAAADAAYGPFVDRMRGHARGFQIDAMAALIAPGLPAAPPP